jgi:hypothetical protein
MPYADPLPVREVQRDEQEGQHQAGNEPHGRCVECEGAHGEDDGPGCPSVGRGVRIDPYVDSDEDSKHDERQGASHVKEPYTRETNTCYVRSPRKRSGCPIAGRFEKPCAERAPLRSPWPLTVRVERVVDERAALQKALVVGFDAESADADRQQSCAFGL